MSQTESTPLPAEELMRGLDAAAAQGRDFLRASFRDASAETIRPPSKGSAGSRFVAVKTMLNVTSAASAPTTASGPGAR